MTEPAPSLVSQSQIPTIAGIESTAARQVIDGLSEDLFPLKRQAEIHCAVAEAILNAIEHGPVAQEPISVTASINSCQATEIELHIEIYAGGPGPKLQVHPLEPWKGLSLLLALSDEIQILRTEASHTLKLIFAASPTGRSGAPDLSRSDG